MQTNRFDLLRLVFAAMVVVFHAAALSAYAPFGPLEHGLGQGAEIAIQGFFITSGGSIRPTPPLFSSRTSSPSPSAAM